MCYSAQVWAHYRDYVRHSGADIDIREFARLYEHTPWDTTPKMPRAMLEDAAQDWPFAREWLDKHRAAQVIQLEQEVFAQRTRLADAERKLAVKVTKAATESRRIATSKVERALAKLTDLKRQEPRDRDSRIFPGWWAPVMIWEGGRRVVKPMRYQCRPEGKPAFYDTKYPGTYNARRDNLQGFWKGQFGHTHGVIMVERFYENVERQSADGKPYNEVLEFRPGNDQVMAVACLWSRWTGADGEELLSFAAITDEPPPEVAAAGHDRCIIPLRSENIDAWLQPNAEDLSALYELLDARERPYYEHRLAA